MAEDVPANRVSSIEGFGYDVRRKESTDSRDLTELLGRLDFRGQEVGLTKMREDISGWGDVYRTIDVATEDILRDAIE